MARHNSHNNGDDNNKSIVQWHCGLFAEKKNIRNVAGRLAGGKSYTQAHRHLYDPQNYESSTLRTNFEMCVHREIGHNNFSFFVHSFVYRRASKYVRTCRCTILYTYVNDVRVILETILFYVHAEIILNAMSNTLRNGRLSLPGNMYMT